MRMFNPTQKAITFFIIIYIGALCAGNAISKGPDAKGTAPLLSNTEKKNRKKSGAIKTNKVETTTFPRPVESSGQPTKPIQSPFTKLPSFQAVAIPHSDTFTSPVISIDSKENRIFLQSELSAFLFYDEREDITPASKLHITDKTAHQFFGQDRRMTIDPLTDGEGQRLYAQCSIYGSNPIYPLITTDLFAQSAGFRRVVSFVVAQDLRTIYTIERIVSARNSLSYDFQLVKIQLATSIKKTDSIGFETEEFPPYAYNTHTVIDTVATADRHASVTMKTTSTGDIEILIACGKPFERHSKKAYRSKHLQVSQPDLSTQKKNKTIYRFMVSAKNSKIISKQEFSQNSWPSIAIKQAPFTPQIGTYSQTIYAPQFQPVEAMDQKDPDDLEFIPAFEERSTLLFPPSLDGDPQWLLSGVPGYTTPPYTARTNHLGMDVILISHAIDENEAEDDDAVEQHTTGIITSNGIPLARFTLDDILPHGLSDNDLQLQAFLLDNNNILISSTQTTPCILKVTNGMQAFRQSKNTSTELPVTEDATTAQPTQPSQNLWVYLFKAAWKKTFGSRRKRAVSQ